MGQIEKHPCPTGMYRAGMGLGIWNLDSGLTIVHESLSTFNKRRLGMDLSLRFIRIFRSFSFLSLKRWDKHIKLFFLASWLIASGLVDCGNLTSARHISDKTHQHSCNNMSSDREGAKPYPGPRLKLDPNNIPQNCPQCQLNGVKSKVKKFRTDPSQSYKVIMCINSQVSWIPCFLEWPF